MRLQHAFDNAVALLKQTGKTGSKRIFFVTHTDDPYATSVNKAGVRRHLENKVRDLATRGIEFVPFLVSTDEKPFDVAKFWGVSGYRNCTCTHALTQGAILPRSPSSQLRSRTAS